MTFHAFHQPRWPGHRASGRLLLSPGSGSPVDDYRLNGHRVPANAPDRAGSGRIAHLATALDRAATRISSAIQGTSAGFGTPLHTREVAGSKPAASIVGAPIARGSKRA